MKPVRAFLVGCGVVVLAAGGSVALAQRPPESGPPGISPREMLMPDMFLAAARNDEEGVKSLLARGAVVDCRNFLSLTPLMLAASAGHEEMVNLLLAKGAELDAPSPYGTALTFAAMTGQSRVARLLIAKGANLNPSRGDRITVLMLAAGNGDLELLKSLTVRNAAVNAKDADGATALIYAARQGQAEVARLLLEKKAEVDAADSHRWTALMYAAANGHPEVAKRLLGKGANPNARDDRGRTPLLLAASYSGDGATIQALIEKGADASVKDPRDRTLFDLLAWRGYQPALATLKTRVAEGGRKLEPPSASAAVQRGLAAIQLSTATFQKRAQCFSCHHQGVGLLATGLARDRGFPIDTKLAAETIERGVREFEAGAPMLQKAVEVPELTKLIPSAEIGDLTPGAAFSLAGVAAHRKPADPALSALAVILGRQQLPDGHWQFGLVRAPIQSSFFTMTALAARALQAYAPKERAGEVADRTGKAKAWLLATEAPPATEDRSFRLLGLKWTGASAKERQPAVTELLALQRPDGGWAQLSSLRSDAYATGQALYALQQGGDVATTTGAYRRGVAFLLRTQDDDGSWYVNKRAIPANNYLDAGFPHGQSQYVSFGATAWATMALALATEPPAARR